MARSIGFRDLAEQFRGDRRGDRPRLLEEAVASGGREFLDGVQRSEQGSPRAGEVAGGFSASDPQQRGGADGGVRLLCLPPSTFQKIDSHGGSLTLWRGRRLCRYQHQEYWL